MEEEGAGVSGAEVERASDLLPLAFLGPLKVNVGSLRFQQFFLIYAKLMVGNPSLDVSCCAMREI